MNSIRIRMAVRFVDRWIVWERIGREKRMDCVRDDGCGAEGEGNAHQRGIELGIPCEDHRGIRSHGDSSDSFIRWDVRITGFRACSLCLLWRSRTSGFAGRQTLPPFDGRWCIKGFESRTMISALWFFSQSYMKWRRDIIFLLYREGSKEETPAIIIIVRS